ncbi:unnamed protein product [Penicillium nalgiovense]|nr:unnamed protein product [Penicillium nalgiovense]
MPPLATSHAHLSISISSAKSPPGNRPAHCSICRWLPSELCHFRLVSRTRSVSAHTRPIGGERVPRVELLERRVSGHRNRDLPVSPIWVETSRLSGFSLGLLPAATRECND